MHAGRRPSRKQLRIRVWLQQQHIYIRKKVREREEERRSLATEVDRRDELLSGGKELQARIPARGMHIQRNEGTAIVLSAGAAKSARRSLHDRLSLSHSLFLYGFSPSLLPSRARFSPSLALSLSFAIFHSHSNPSQLAIFNFVDPTDAGIDLSLPRETSGQKNRYQSPLLYTMCISIESRAHLFREKRAVALVMMNARMVISHAHTGHELRARQKM